MKIGSKAIAKRLEAVLPCVIHHNQCTYVKDRTICDAVRSIEDIFIYTKRYQIEGRLISIDFKKAFDSVSRDFLFRTLRPFILVLLLYNGFPHFIIIYQAVF